MPTIRGPIKEDDCTNQYSPSLREREMAAHLVGDREQAVPARLLAGRDDLSVECARIALERAVERAEVHCEHVHLRRHA